MSVNSWVAILKQTFGRGMFPQEMSFALDLPLRNILLSPRKLVARLAFSSTSHVLEVGPGSGFYSLEVARTLSNGYLELVDIQPKMLRKAQQKLVAKGMSNVGYAVADASQLSFRGESFDLVFLVTVLGEIVDQSAFLHEAYRVLKGGGILSISEHYPDPDFSPFSDLRPCVEKVGFQFLERFGGKWNYTVNFGKPSSTLTSPTSFEHG